MAKRKKTTKRRGRPTKYKPEFVQKAEELCKERGYTDENLAVHFKIKNTAFYDWKKRFPEFAEAIKKGKDDFDSRVVEQALLKRATGYTYDEITKEPAIVDKGVVDGKAIKKKRAVEKAVEESLVVTKVVTKQVAADVTADIFWLKNRNPKRWKDKRETELSGDLNVHVIDYSKNSNSDGDNSPT